LVISQLKILDLAGSDGAEEVNYLLLHISATPDHIEAGSISISNSNSMRGGDVALLHLGDYLDDLFRVGDLSISQENDMADVVLHFLLHFDDVLSGSTISVPP
jgi:hypothetical protein